MVIDNVSMDPSNALNRNLAVDIPFRALMPSTMMMTSDRNPDDRQARVTRLSLLNQVDFLEKQNSNLSNVIELDMRGREKNK